MTDDVPRRRTPARRGEELYPVMLDLRDRAAVVVGAGSVGARRAVSLLRAGSRVTVVDRAPSKGVLALVRSGQLALRERSYERGDLAGADLALVATDDPETASHVAAEARDLGIPVNVADRPELCDFQIPAVVRRGRLQVAISTGGASPAWAARLRRKFGEMLGSEHARLFDALAVVRQRVLSEIPKGRERSRILCRLADEGLLALAREEEDGELLHRIEEFTGLSASSDRYARELRPHSGTGSVALVGAGPGDPDLITVRGLRLLEEAEVIVHDRLIPRELLDRCRMDAEVIDAGKGRGWHTRPQDEIVELLVDRARRGLRVVRLKGGDPCLFGRGWEEASALSEDGIPFEIVPGITAALGTSSHTGIPLTARGVSSSVTLVTGHDGLKAETGTRWEALAAVGGTLVVYMGLKHLEDIAAALIRGGRSADTPSAVVHRATTSRQEIVSAPLGEIARKVRDRGLRPPSLLLVGEVVSRRTPWFRSNVLATEPEDPSPEGAATRSGGSSPTGGESRISV